MHLVFFFLGRVTSLLFFKAFHKRFDAAIEKVIEGRVHSAFWY